MIDAPGLYVSTYVDRLQDYVVTVLRTVVIDDTARGLQCMVTAVFGDGYVHTWTAFSENWMEVEL